MLICRHDSRQILLFVFSGPIGYRLAASLAAEEERELTEKAEASSVSALAVEEGDDDENEEMILVSFLTHPSCCYYF